MGETQGTHGAIQSAGNFDGGGFLAQAQGRRKKRAEKKGLPSHTHKALVITVVTANHTGQSPAGNIHFLRCGVMQEAR